MVPLGVVDICDGAFEGCKSVKSIIIPDSVIGIGWGVFAGCESLKRITIPVSVKNIYGSPFDSFGVYKSWNGELINNSPYLIYENGRLHVKSQVLRKFGPSSLISSIDIFRRTPIKRR